MGFEVILVGAIAGFFVIKHFMKADQSSEYNQLNESDQSVVNPQSAATGNPSPYTLSEVESDLACSNTVPQDSSLRRHYLQQLEAERLAITDPHPTEFNLKRHFLAEMKHLLAVSQSSTAKPEVSVKPAKATAKAKSPAKATPAKEAKKAAAPAKAQAKPKAAPKPKAESKPKAEPKAKAESKPKAEPKVKAEPKPKADSKPKSKAKPAKTQSE